MNDLLSYLENQFPAAKGNLVLKQKINELMEKSWFRGMTNAARIVESWGDECAGGSGGEIVPSGPTKGQRYGEGYYNLSKAILKERDKQINSKS